MTNPFTGPAPADNLDPVEPASPGTAHKPYTEPAARTVETSDDPVAVYAAAVAARVAAAQHLAETVQRAAELAPVAGRLRERYLDGDDTVTHATIDAAEADHRHAELDAEAARRAHQRAEDHERALQGHAFVAEHKDAALSQPGPQFEADIKEIAARCRATIAALYAEIAEAAAPVEAHNKAVRAIATWAGPKPAGLAVGANRDSISVDGRSGSTFDIGPLISAMVKAALPADWIKRVRLDWINEIRNTVPAATVVQMQLNV